MAHFSNSGVAYPSHGYQSQSSPVNGQKSRRQPAPFQDVEESAIAIMGATGSGKSTFINLVSGSQMAVGAGLKSCTSAVETTNTFQLYGRSVTLIDTPGFDDTTVSDTDILKMIAIYLSTTYQNGHKLSGIIYMHRISDFRVGGISRRNFSMFRKLCGDETLRNVAIVTNMWGEVSPERGAAREQELRSDDLLFKQVLEKGAEMIRHDNTLESAQAILWNLVNKRPRVLRIQRELVDEGKDITQTAAGEELDRELAALAKKHMEQLAEVQKEMEEALATKDMETKKELEEVRNDLMKNMEKIENDRDRLSREYAEEKKRADAKMKEIETALEAEKESRAQRQIEIKRLTREMQENQRATTAQREEMRKEIQRLQNQPKRGFFSRIGHAIDSLF